MYAFKSRIEDRADICRRYYSQRFLETVIQHSREGILGTWIFDLYRALLLREEVPICMEV
jgi:hypothetical protein